MIQIKSILLHQINGFENNSTEKQKQILYNRRSWNKPTAYIASWPL